MQPYTLEQARAGAVVRVELVCDREFKDDCRNNTGIVWHGKGDIQPYPANLWPRLAVHPDVWKLADDQGDGAAPPEQVRSESLEAERKRLGTAEAERVAAASEVKASETRAAELAGQGIDSVTATVPDQTFAETYDYLSLTPAVQEAMAYEAMRDLAAKLDYGLNYRLGEKNLRLRFAAVTQDRIDQAEEEEDTTGVDDTGGPGA